MFKHMKPIEILKPIGVDSRDVELQPQDFAREDYNILSVSMSEKESTLQELLDNQFKPEFYDATRNKEYLKCGDKNVVKCELTQKISTLSDYVIIQFNRFSYKDGVKKIKTEITFPTDEQGVTLPLTKDGITSEVKYQIVSYINHIGPGPTAGHYIAYTRANKGQDWVFYNDDKKMSPIDPMTRFNDGINDYNTKEHAYIIVLKKADN